MTELCHGRAEFCQSCNILKSCLRFGYQGIQALSCVIFPASMQMRLVTAIAIVCGLLFTQGGNYVLAALCPHLQANETACASKPEHASASHHDIDEAQPSRESRKSDVLQIENQRADCSHCVVHSRTRRDERAVRKALVWQRTDYQNTAVIVPAIHSADVSKSTSWAAKSHGPPEVSVPLHVLINVFRI
jgi:hypothetical protein